MITTVSPPRTTVTDWGAWPVWPSAAGGYPASPAGMTRAGATTAGEPAWAVPGIPAAKGVAIGPDAGRDGTLNPVPKWAWWRRVP